MPVKTILILALFAALITSWSLIEPPGCTIVLIPALINVVIPSAKGKKASEAATEFLILDDWNCFAFCVAILQLSKRLGCPAPMPIVEKLLHKIIAFDFTYLQILKANSISASSFLFGFSFVTNFNFFLSKIIWSLLWIKKDPSKFLIVVRFLSLNLDMSIILKFFFLFKMLRAFLSNPFAKIT